MSTSQHQVPEWEAPSAPPRRGFLNKPAFLSSASPRTSEPVSKEGESPLVAEEAVVSQRRGLSSRLPPSIARLGRNRKVLLISLAAIVLLILILGLSLGLTLNKGKKHKNLPLPTGKGSFNGDLTYYSPGPGYGACGYENTSQDAICAVSHLVWDAVSTSSNPNNNPLCGKKLRITRFDPAQGRNNSVDVMVVDRCTGCKPTDIDLSIKMFEVLADEDQGRVVGTWAWLDYP